MFWVFITTHQFQLDNMYLNLITTNSAKLGGAIALELSVRVRNGDRGFEFLDRRHYSAWRLIFMPISVIAWRGRHDRFMTKKTRHRGSLSAGRKDKNTRTEETLTLSGFVFSPLYPATWKRLSYVLFSNRHELACVRTWQDYTHNTLSIWERLQLLTEYDDSKKRWFGKLIKENK